MTIVAPSFVRLSPNYLITITIGPLQLCYLHDSRPWESDPDSLVFAHEDGGHDLTGFCPVKECVLQCQQVGPCEEKVVFKYCRGPPSWRLFDMGQDLKDAANIKQHVLRITVFWWKDHGNDTHQSESPE